MKKKSSRRKNSGVLTVTEADHRRQVFKRVDPETVLKPGRYPFRRGSLAELHGSSEAEIEEAMKPRNVKIGVYIKLDSDVFNFFKARATPPGALPYQTQINAELRRIMEQEQASGPDVVGKLKEATTLIQTAIRTVQDRGAAKRARKPAD